MKFIKNLYVSNSIKNPDKVISKLKRNAGQIMVYIISISENSTDQLDIYHCSVMQQKYFHKNKNFMIVGITGSYEEAVEFVKETAVDCLKIRGNCKLKEYLLSEDFKGTINDRG